MFSYIFDVIKHFLTRGVWGLIIWLWTMFCLIITLISVGYFLNKFLRPKFIRESLWSWLSILLTFAICYGLMHGSEFMKTAHNMSSCY